MQKTTTVMLIDDSNSERALFRFVLSEIDKKINYLPFEGGDSALKYLRTHLPSLPDFIFLDVNMNGMNGLECLQLIRKIKELDHVPVIMYTTADVENIEEAAKLLGATLCLGKSIDYNETCRVVSDILNHEGNHHK